MVSKGRECEAAGRGCKGVEGGRERYPSRGGVCTHLRLYIRFLISEISERVVRKVFIYYFLNFLSRAILVGSASQVIYLEQKFVFVNYFVQDINMNGTLHQFQTVLQKVQQCLTLNFKLRLAISPALPPYQQKLTNRNFTNIFI